MSVVDRARSGTDVAEDPVQDVPDDRASDTTTGTRPALVGVGLDALVLAPLLLGTAYVLGLGLDRAPRRSESEGTLVSLAWSALHGGGFSGAGQPAESVLAWLQVSGWGAATGAFDRAPTAVAAGRELMVVAAVVTAALLWALARRLDLPRWAAATAVTLYALHPLGLEVHRTVSGAGLAVPWLLAAMVLVLQPRGRSRSLYLAAACAGVAVFVHGSSLLLLPVLALLVWPQLRRRPRRRAVLAAAAVVAQALVLLDAAALVSGATGIVDPLGIGDTVLAAAGPVGPLEIVIVTSAAAGVLVLRRLRAVGAGMLLLVAVGVGTAVFSGSTPASVVVLGLPLAALVVPGALDAWLRYRPTRLRGHDVRAVTLAVGGGTALAVVVLLGLEWPDRVAALTTDDPDAPLVDATDWARENVPTDEALLAPDTLWVDLVRQGRPTEDVVRPGDVGPDGASLADVPWFVSTEDVRAAAAADRALARALDGSVVMASFGEGPARVELRRTAPPRGALPEVPSSEVGAAAAQEFVRNPAVTTSEAAREDLLEGRVDDRVLLTLVTLSASHTLTVDGFPRDLGDTEQTTLRAVRISAIDGRPATAGTPGVDDVMRIVSAQRDEFRPSLSFADAEGSSPPSEPDAPAALVLVFPQDAS